MASASGIPYREINGEGEWSSLNMSIGLSEPIPSFQSDVVCLQVT